MPAFKLGRWDGKIRLMSARGKTFLNLLDDVLPIFEDRGYEFEVEDHRRDYQHILDDIEERGLPDENYFSEYELKGEQVVLRDYQVDAINTAIQEGSGLLEMATGSGKTLTCAAISDYYSKYGNVVVIVPNIDLAVQTQGLFRNVGIDAGIWYMDVKDRREVTISTWQSLDHYPELFSDVVCCIVDEAHQAKAKTLTEILSGPGAGVPFRFGCTGTVPKEELYRKQIFGVIGPIIFRLTSWELQNFGVLAESNIYQIRLKDSKNPNYPNLGKDERGRRINPFDDINEQVKWFLGDEVRMQYLANLIMDTAKNDGNTLVLVQHHDTVEKLAGLIPEAVALDGRIKSDKRRKEYEAFNEKEGGILIATYGIASTGIDIPRIFNLIVFEPGQKFEKIMQTIGRALRRADDKSSMNMLDVHGDLDNSRRHATERRKLYQEHRHKCETVEVDYYADS